VRRRQRAQHHQPAALLLLKGLGGMVLAGMVPDVVVVGCGGLLQA